MSTLALLWLLLDAILVCVLLWDDICFVWTTLALLWLVLNVMLICVLLYVSFLFEQHYTSEKNMKYSPRAGDNNEIRQLLSIISDKIFVI